MSVHGTRRTQGTSQSEQEAFDQAAAAAEAAVGQAEEAAALEEEVRIPWSLKFACSYVEAWCCLLEVHASTRMLRAYSIH